MDFRRSQLDDRRRRVLMEEVAAPAEEPLESPAAGKRTPTKAYGDAVLTDLQWRISDLVPVRPFALTVLILGMLTGVAAIEALYIYWQTMPIAARSPMQTPAIDLSALDLTLSGSVAGWFCSLLLAAGACGALVVFSIRCHRVDDYRGRYRVWLWMGAGLLCASLDAATGIHDSIGGLMGRLAGSPQLATLGWLALFLLVFGALGIRLGMETWHALGAFATLSLAAVLYLVAGMMVAGWITPPGYLLATVIETSTIMLAHVALISGLAIYARHVHLDAEGKLPLRLRMQGNKPKKKTKARLSVVREDGEKSAPEGDKVAAKAANSPGSTPASRPGPLASRVAAAAADDEEEDDAEDARDGNDQLSKSERRRLKKLMRQQRRAA